ncbi:MAG: ABC transporter ATP-binding protein [Candidatus Dormibacteraeota bacterium]|nr:ABC transporter ATP-binding protein [Candidatus Dormibacteraeota bacterium]
MSAIEVTALVKRYRGARTNALDGLSFSVEDGQFFCLLGPNGAGKTTAVSILTTTLVPTSGSVHIAGHDLASQEPLVRRALGVVFQSPSLDLNLTAEENLRLHAMLYGLYAWRPLRRLMPRAYRDQVEQLAGILGVAGVLEQRARKLSGGTRRKLEIVRALMHRPRVLFLDEPAAGLDPESRRDLWSYLRGIRDREGTTLFLTTHHLEEAEDADAVCVLAQGRAVELASPADLKRRLGGSELVLDAADRSALGRELAALGLTVQGAGPLRVALDGRSAQAVVRGLHTELTLLQIEEPSLEETYIKLLAESRR